MGVLLLFKMQCRATVGRYLSNQVNIVVFYR